LIGQAVSMCLLTHAEGVSTRRHRRPSREHVPVRFWGLPLSVEQLSSAAKVTGTLDGARDARSAPEVR
jgi:hypothetical protein